MQGSVKYHDDVIKWKHFPRYWPFVRGIHRSPANSPHKGQWRGALMFSLICVWINGWVNNREAGDLRRYRTHYDVTVVIWYPSETHLKLKSRKISFGHNLLLNYPQSFQIVLRAVILPCSVQNFETIGQSQRILWANEISRCLSFLRLLWQWQSQTVHVYVVYMMTSSNWKNFRVLVGGWDSPVTGEFPSQRPVTRGVDAFFDLRLNKRLSKPSGRWWFETPSRSLWRHCDEIMRHRLVIILCAYARILNCARPPAITTLSAALYILFVCFTRFITHLIYVFFDWHIEVG